MNFIDDYCRLMRYTTDASPEFIRASALFLVSTVTGRNAIIPTMEDRNLLGATHRGQLLNLWFILLGNARSMINRTIEFLNYAFEKGVRLSTMFTTKSLLSELEKTPHAAWIRNECRDFFTSAQGNSDLYLAEIYEGDSIRNTTLRRAELIDNPYLTILLASTEDLTQYFDPEMFETGFLSAFIFVPNQLEDQSFLVQQFSDDLRIQIQALADQLKMIREFFADTAVCLILAPEAHEELAAFKEEIEEHPPFSSKEPYQSYLDQLPKLALRIAGIQTIARLTMPELQTNPTNLQITGQDMKTAVDYVGQCLDWFLNVRLAIELPTEDTESKQYHWEKPERNRIINDLYETGGISQEKLGEIFGISRQRIGYICRMQRLKRLHAK